MDWHELEKKKVTELREMAKDKTDLEGLTGLHKDELVAAVANALGIEKPHLVVEKGAGKSAIKQTIRVLRSDVTEALASKDRALARRKRRQIHRLKRRIRRMAHLTH